MLLNFFSYIFSILSPLLIDKKNHKRKYENILCLIKFGFDQPLYNKKVIIIWVWKVKRLKSLGYVIEKRKTQL